MSHCTARTATAQVSVQRRALFGVPFKHLHIYLSYLERDNKCSSTGRCYTRLRRQRQKPQRLAKYPCMVCNPLKASPPLSYSCTVIGVRICAICAFIQKNYSNHHNW